MDSVVAAQLLGGLSLTSMLKVVHSVIDSLNRRRAPSRDILLEVDGPDEADRVADIASLVVRRIEGDEGRSISEMPRESIRRYAEMLLSAANDQARRDLPPVDEARARALLEDLRKGAA